METNKKNILKSWPVLVVFLLLIAAMAWVFTDKNADNPHNIAINADSHDHRVAVDEPRGNNPPTLETIVKYARTWRPIFERWYGKKASDVSFVDLQGKSHKLSEYAGKDVLLLFWATWCPPCRAEIPGLIELRKLKKPSELAIIAISDENPGIVKQFAAKNGMNYTVGGLNARPGIPFESIRSLPTSFYIDKEGKLKLAVEGMISMEETMAIINAKE